MVIARDGDRDPISGSLVVGNYCHDVLHRDGRTIRTLGGASAFISNVLDSLSPFPSRYISKVGADFSYSVSHPPLISASSLTTLFHAHFPDSSLSYAGYHGDRVLKRIHACEPIYSSDLAELKERFDFGLAVGVAGEIPIETLQRMIELCRVIFVDVQGLIRSFDPVDGTVDLIPLRSTPFFNLLPQIGFLKMSSDEAPFVDIEEARKRCCVVVTEGKDGCRVYWRGGEMHVAPFPANQVDPTGAGDSFFGGFVVGLLWGLTVPDAALVGNLLGSFTVGQVGVPTFDQIMLEVCLQILTIRFCTGLCSGAD
jgi:1D-myo-inositol 3-kinase